MNDERAHIERLVDIAEAIAREAHATHVDKAGAPYIEHVARVAGAFGEGDPIARTVAWLHDVIEDAAPAYRDRVFYEMPPRIAVSVFRVTRIGTTKTYAEFIESIVESGDAVAMRVKLADVADHLRDTTAIPESYVKKYRRAHAVLFEAAAKIATPSAAIY